MGVRFAREYVDIIDDMVDAVVDIERIFEFFEMQPQEWEEMSSSEQKECLKTLADDVFYGLGNDPLIHIGAGKVAYNKDKHILEIFNGEKCVQIIQLV